MPRKSRPPPPHPVPDISILNLRVDTPTLIQTFIVNRAHLCSFLDTAVTSAAARFAPCLQAQGNYNGAHVIIGQCDPWHGAYEEWVVVNGGGVEGTGDPGPVTQIRIFGDKCLDVTNGVDEDGVKLQIWKCYPYNTNQLWQWGDNGIRWVSHDK